MEEHEKWMRRCIELARKGRMGAPPNPMVGAVIVHEGRIIGEGYHRRCGEAHAEVNAVTSVRERHLLPHSTLYVSLEPCSHYGKTPLLMVLEDLQDPGNVGTIIRTAEGAGVTGIIMSRGTADIFNPKTIRSTMGSIYRMPFLIVDDAVGFVKGLKARKICTYAAHLHGVHSYREEDYTKGTAFLIGNEGNGLTDAMAEAAECLIRIPMEGKVESLNAAIASAVLMYEAHGQRA